MTKNLLLLSGGSIRPCIPEMNSFLKENKASKLLFIPYAGYDLDKYADMVKQCFEIDFESLHKQPDEKAAIENAQAVFAGGGNTFRLLKTLYDKGLLEIIRKRANEGMPYMGASAGSNIACPTIKTTNDMPIVYPPSLNALNLVNFNINPHYLDPLPKSVHKGETREERINEFHQENEITVIGLREGAMLRITDDKILLKGEKGARVFQKGKEPVEYEPGASLDFLK